MSAFFSKFFPITDTVVLLVKDQQNGASRYLHWAIVLDS